MKTLESYKKAFYIRIFGLIFSSVFFFAFGIVLICMTIFSENFNGLILGISFTFVGIIFFTCLPFLIAHGKKVILKDEEELKLLKNKGDKNDDDKI